VNNQGEEQYHKWKSEFRRLDREIDYFLKEFLQNRTCKCKNDECKHYKIKRKMKFGNKIDKLYHEKLMIGYSTFAEVINQN